MFIREDSFPAANYDDVKQAIVEPKEVTFNV